MILAGRPGVLRLDRPANNFDVAGIPREEWSSGLCSCHENILPSCVCSCCCTPVVFGQLSVRAQIPLFIDIKNSLFGHGNKLSGYCLFTQIFLWMFLITVALVYIGVFLTKGTLSLFCLVIAFGGAALFCFIVSHLRTALKAKYSIKGPFPEGSEAWNCMFDLIVSLFCLPCSFAQMARHVFQYDKWDPKIGALYCGDPSLLPPLETDIRRPPESDTAGLENVDNDIFRNERVQESNRNYRGAGAFF